jgi:hypothetical protein
MLKFLATLPVHIIAIVILAAGLTFAALGGVLFDAGVWWLGEEYVEKLMKGGSDGGE